MERISKRSHNQIKLVQTRALTNCHERMDLCTRIEGRAQNWQETHTYTHTHDAVVVAAVVAVDGEWSGEKEGRPAIVKAVKDRERELHRAPAEVANNESRKESITCGCCENGCFTVGSLSFASYEIRCYCWFSHIWISHLAMRSHTHKHIQRC